MDRQKHKNDRPPNFYSVSGKFYLVRCYVCNPEHGTENTSLTVSQGVCFKCGWDISKQDPDYNPE